MKDAGVALLPKAQAVAQEYPVHPWRESTNLAQSDRSLTDSVLSATMLPTAAATN
jgi:hypothetical protein